jgi:hypothetical protein
MRVCGVVPGCNPHECSLFCLPLHSVSRLCPWTLSVTCDGASRHWCALSADKVPRSVSLTASSNIDLLLFRQPARLGHPDELDGTAIGCILQGPLK